VNRFLIASTLLATTVGSLALAADIYASNEIARETGLVCTTCHDKPGSKLLTDKGKYYELMGSLDGFDEIGEAYGSCTACHVKKPGSKKLTAEGKRLARAIADMDALRALVLEQHPAAPASADPAQGSAPGVGSSTGSGDVILLPAH